MRLTVRMESNVFGGPSKKDVTHDGGAATRVRPAGPADLENVASIRLHRRWNFTEMARGPRFHTTTLTGGLGLLLLAPAP